MLHIGAHLSMSKGFLAMGKEASEMNADTFAFFLRNPRGGAAKAIDIDDINSFSKYAQEHNFARLVAHAPYTLNPCAAKPDLRNYAFDTMLDDLVRMSCLPGNFYNFHPGSHVQQGSDVGIELTSVFLARVCAAQQGLVENSSFKEKSEAKTTVLVEAMAGKGSEIGKTFEELDLILSKAEEKYLSLTSNSSGAQDFSSLAGICIDTCHIWDGGYDISNIDDVMERFDKTVGLNRLHAVHINDSMNELGAHKDRHQKIGEGFIGFETLLNVTRHEALKDKPFILETPNEFEGYRKEIEMLRQGK